MKKGWHGEIECVCRDAQGNIKWQETITNALADEGEEQILDVYLRGATAPSNFYLRLYNDTPAETDTLALLTGEASGNGYAAVTLAATNVGWPTLALNSGDFMATSATATYTASGGNIGPVTYVVLATAETGTSGKLVAYAALSQTRTLANGETLDLTYKVKLQ